MHSPHSSPAVLGQLFRVQSSVCAKEMVHVEYEKSEVKGLPQGIEVTVTYFALAFRYVILFNYYL